MAKKEEEVKVPSMYDPEWTPYVLSLLNDKTEIVNGFPKCDGLRRVFEKLIGPILSINVIVAQPPNNNNHNRSTVIVKMDYLDEALKTTRTVSDATDVDQFNTDSPYNKYPTATAVTGAEGRCLRKALRLINTRTLEESQVSNDVLALSDALANNQPISPTQKNVIVNVSNTLGINVAALLKSIPDLNVVEVANLTYLQAQQVIGLLTQYRKSPDDGGLIVPKEILN